MESYGALATELASLGYVVIGLDHPFQSAPVLVSDTVAVSSGDPRSTAPRRRPSSTADDVVAVTRGFVAAFLDRVLRGAPVSVFGEVVAPTDVLVEVYPLDRQ